MLARPDFPELVKRLHLAKTAHYVRIVEQGGLPLRPGVARLIQRGPPGRPAPGHRHHHLAGKCRRPATRQPRPDGANWFEVIGAGDVVPAKKPAPDIYRWVLERLGLPASDCLAVEDSENGLKSALTAGVPCLVTIGEYTRGQDFSGACAVLEDLGNTSLADLARLADSGNQVRR